MTRPLCILECALQDLTQAAAWYTQQVPVLGQSFLLHVENALDRIERSPETYQIDFGAVHRALTRRYPYAIYYRVKPQTIEVIAVCKCRLDPKPANSHFGTSSDPA